MNGPAAVTKNSRLPESSRAAREIWEKCAGTDPDAVIQACTAIVQTGQESPQNVAQAFLNRGNTYFSRTDYDKAVSDYGAAIEAAPGDVRPYNDRGAAYLKKQQYELAIRDFNRGLELNPNDADLLYNRGGAYLRQHFCTLASADFDRAAALSPDYAARVRAAAAACQGPPK